MVGVPPADVTGVKWLKNTTMCIPGPRAISQARTRFVSRMRLYSGLERRCCCNVFSRTYGQNINEHKIQVLGEWRLWAIVFVLFSVIDVTERCFSGSSYGLKNMWLRFLFFFFVVDSILSMELIITAVSDWTQLLLKHTLSLYGTYVLPGNGVSKLNGPHWVSRFKSAQGKSFRGFTLSAPQSRHGNKTVGVRLG